MSVHEENRDARMKIQTMLKSYASQGAYNRTKLINLCEVTSKDL